MNNIIYQTNARKGMALMNQVNGREWVLDFSLEAFDIISVSFCVIGQHYGDYEEGLRELMDLPDGKSLTAMIPLAVQYGFDGNRYTDMRQLQAEWTALIYEQKAELGS
jgi:hypothetical protein